MANYYTRTPYPIYIGDGQYQVACPQCNCEHSQPATEQADDPNTRRWGPMYACINCGYKAHRDHMAGWEIVPDRRQA